MFITSSFPHGNTHDKIKYMTLEVTDSNFETEVLNSDIPVMVDFWAPWCGPCRALSPIIDQVAEEYAGKIKVVKLNTDENPESAVKFRITSIPNLIIFKEGKPIDQLIGSVDKTKIDEVFSKLN